MICDNTCNYGDTPSALLNFFGYLGAVYKCIFIIIIIIINLYPKIAIFIYENKQFYFILQRASALFL